MIVVSLGARVCQSAAPLALLTHKRTATCVRTAGACVSYLLPFGAHRDRIVLRDIILVLVLGRSHFMPLHMLCLVHMLRLVHMLPLFCLSKSNRDGECKQRDSERLQHPFCDHIGWYHCQDRRTTAIAADLPICLSIGTSGEIARARARFSSAAGRGEGEQFACHQWSRVHRECATADDVKPCALADRKGPLIGFAHS